MVADAILNKIKDFVTHIAHKTVRFDGLVKINQVEGKSDKYFQIYYNLKKNKMAAEAILKVNILLCI